MRRGARCPAALRRLLASTRPARAGRLRRLLPLPTGLVGLAGAGLFFYALGRVALSLPDAFHEGSVWRRPAWETPEGGNSEAQP